VPLRLVGSEMCIRDRASRAHNPKMTGSNPVSTI
jgi:hypothetical protein